MSDLKIQGEVSLDSSNAEEALGRVETAGGKMARAVGQSGADAGKGVAAIGDGAGVAAQKIDRSAQSIIGAIQRQTVALESGGRATSKYYETIGQQKGISADILKPYIYSLRQAEIAQSRATGEVASGGHAMEQFGFQTAGAKRELLVLTHELSQGNFSRFGSSLLVLGERTGAAGALMSATAISVGVLVAGIGLLAYAAAKGGSELKGFENSATLTGNAIGKTATQFGELRAEIGSIATQGKAAEALDAIAASGLRAGTNVKSIAEAAILMEKATGQAIETTIAQFKDLERAPAETAAKLIDQSNAFTAATYAQIKALDEQGKKVEAANLAERAYASELQTRARMVIDNAGTMEKAWRAVTNVAKSAWDAMLGIGRQVTTGQQITTLQQQIASLQDRNKNIGIGDANGDTKHTQELKDQIGILQSQEREARKLADLDGQRAAAAAAEVDWQKIVDANLTKRQQMEREINRIRQTGLEAGKSEAQIQKEVAAARQKYNELAGGQDVAQQRASLRVAQEELGRLNQSIANLDFSTPTKLTDAEKKVILIEEQLKESILGVARANKERELAAAQAAVATEKEQQSREKQYQLVKQSHAAYLQLVADTSAQAQAIEQQAAQQEAANAVFGKSKTAVEELVLAQLKLQQEEAHDSDTFAPQYVAGVDAKVAAQQRYVKALQDAEAHQIAAGQRDRELANQQDAATLQLELSLLGQTVEVRQQVLAQRQIEINLAKELKKIDDSGASDADKDAARLRERNIAEQATVNAATKYAVERWQKASDEISDALTGAFTDAFENGSNLGKNLAQALKREFANLVLRPTIQAAMSPISSALGSAVQGGSALPGGGGLFAGVGNAFMAGYGGSGAGLGAGSAFAAGGAAEGAFGVGAGATGALDLAGAGGDAAISALAVEGGAAAGGIGAGVTAALAAIPVVGWMALAAAAAYKIFGQSGGGPKTESGYGSGVPVRGDASAAQAVINAISAGYKQAADAIGAKDTLDNLGAFIGSDPQGTAQTQLQVIAGNYNRGTLTGGGPLGENVGRDPAALAQAEALSITQAIVKGLQDNAVSGPLADYVKSFDITSASLDTLQHALQVVTDVGTLNTALGALGDTFTALKGLSVDNKEALAQQFGGVQNFVAGLTNFNDKFLSDAEKQAVMQQQLNAVFSQAGVSLPASIEAYKAAVLDAEQHLDSDAGRQTFATLIQNADLFYQAAQVSGSALGRTAQDISQSIANLSKQTDSLHVQLLRAQGNDSAANALQVQIDTAGMTDAEKAIYDYNAALQAQITALNNAAQVTSSLTQSQRSLMVQLLQAQGDSEGAKSLQRAFDTEGFDAAQVAMYDYNQTLQDQIDLVTRTNDLTKQGQSLQVNLLNAQGDTAGAKALQRSIDIAGLTDAQVALYDYNQSLQDQIDTLTQAAQVTKSLTDAQNSLRVQLLGAQGDMAGAAALQREIDTAGMNAAQIAIYDYNKSLQAQIDALNAANAAQQKAAQAAKQVKQAWQSVTDAIFAQVQTIRTAGSPGSDSFAQAQAQFAIDTAKARAGDQDAAKLLPTLSQTLLSMAQDSVSSSLELRQLQARTASSLETTGLTLAQKFNLDTPAWANDLTTEMRGLRADNKAQSVAVVKNLYDTYRIFKEWDANGLPDTRSEVAP